MIITIDGPSGVGKGTIGQKLARKLGFHLLDSGALYRLTALAAVQKNVDFADEVALARLAENLNIEFLPGENGIRYFLYGKDVSDDIRNEAVGMNASKVGASQSVRQALLDLQREFDKAPGLVADGRDMGTTVFPDADIKVFLSASAEERARRRIRQLEEKGESADFQQILADIEARDKQDREREISPLKPADDAIEMDTTSMSISEVLKAVLALL